MRTGTWCVLAAALSARAADPVDSGVRLEAVAAGGFSCRAATYAARLDTAGNLVSLAAGGTEFLARAGAAGPAAGFVHAGGFVPLRRATLAAADTLLAEVDPRDPATAVAGPPCPFTARLTWQFLPDHLELRLAQSQNAYGSFAWIPSPAVLASHDALTEFAIAPGGPAPYGQTDPRWTTREGPVLRFDLH